MHPLCRQLLHFFRAHAQKPIIVAYSGGVDSQVVLHALATLKQQGLLTQDIQACHVNHGLSPKAGQWQIFAEQQCLQLQVPITTHRLSLQKQAQHSLEALARDARYQALISCCEQSAFIVTGHHQDDQAETLLLALKRGAGLKGLAAMAELTRLARHELVRPLLTVSRAQIVEYAQRHQLDWIEDESNQDQCFDRNFIRQSVMPLLHQRWPAITKTINRSASLCQDGQALLDEIATEDLAKVQCSRSSLSIVKLLQLSERRRNNVLRYFIAEHNKTMPSVKQLQEVTKLLNAQVDKCPVVNINDYALRRFQQQLYLTEQYQDISDFNRLLTLSENKGKLLLPDNCGQLLWHLLDEQSVISSNLVDYTATRESNLTELNLLAPEDNTAVSIRFSHDNPKCLPHFRDKSRPLKKILQEAKIPTWQRQRLPLIFYGDTLVAVAGLFVVKEFLPRSGQALLKLHWHANDLSG